MGDGSVADRVLEFRSRKWKYQCDDGEAGIRAHILTKNIFTKLLLYIRTVVISENK